MTWTEFNEKAKKIYGNKYIIVCLVFALVILFAGEHSLVRILKRGVKVRQAEEQLEKKQADIKRCTNDIHALHNTDSLEKYAREHYFMHKPDEDVYLVAD